MEETVSCPVTVTSPAPDPGFLAMGGKANMVCGASCSVSGPVSAVVQCRCPMGHEFVHAIGSGGDWSGDAEDHIMGGGWEGRRNPPREDET